jgi:hypothetical protein
MPLAGHRSLWITARETGPFLDIGREDVDIAGITPCNPRLTILGASSDHLLVDVTAAHGVIRVGDEIAFSLNYSALLATMTSQYVGKRPLYASKDTPENIVPRGEDIGLPDEPCDAGVYQS